MNFQKSRFPEILSELDSSDSKIHTGWYVGGTQESETLERPGSRDPERTRERLLQAAFHEIYRSGFQSASLDEILASAGVTKGALYYHFNSKEALGYAVVDEVIAPDVHGKWVRPLRGVKDPIDALIGAVQRIPVRPADVRGGCQLEQSGARNVSS